MPNRNFVDYSAMAYDSSNDEFAPPFCDLSVEGINAFAKGRYSPSELHSTLYQGKSCSAEVDF